MRISKRENINFSNSNEIISNLIQNIDKVKISTRNFRNSEWFEIGTVVIIFTAIMSLVAMVLRTLK